MRKRKDKEKECGNGDRPRSPVSAELAARVKELALASVPLARQDFTNLYLDTRVLEPGTTIGPVYQPLTVDRPSVLVFEDDDPIAQFGHECRYLFHDVQKGEPYRTVVAQFPPYPLLGLDVMDGWWQPLKPKADECVPGVMRALQKKKKAKKKGNRTGAATGRRFAILFAGDMDDYHLNDLELSYRMLREVYGFDADNIWVLVHDGTDTGAPFRDPDGNVRQWPGNGTDFLIGPPDGPGTKVALKNQLAHLKTMSPPLGPNDSVFIHTEGHGGHFDFSDDAFAFLGCLDGEYQAHEFATDLADLPPHKSLLVLMNQCYGGGFSAAVLNKSRATCTSIACAATAGRLAHAAWNLGKLWSDFSLDWMEGQMRKFRHPGGTAVPDPPPVTADGAVRARDAFDYAVRKSERRDSPNITPYTTPYTPPSPADDISLR